MTSAIQIVTTTETLAEAQGIAEALLRVKQAGCVQIDGPIESHYRWQGELQLAQEWRCLIKTDRRLYREVEQQIKAIHSYDEPEIIALPIESASAGYLEWLSEQLDFQSMDAPSS